MAPVSLDHMQPFSRETIVDRRQAYIRWTAVFAGAAIAAGLWLLLQLIFTGGALTAVDADDVENARAFGIGTTVSSVLAPLLAMFAGGLIAGRIANHYDRKVAGLHGGLVWALTSLLGVVLLSSAVSALLDRTPLRGHADMMAPAPGTRAYVDDSLRDLNARLKAQGAPQISVDAFIDAAHHGSVGRDAGVDREAFIARLDDKTKLSRPETEAALDHLGQRAADVIAAAGELGAHRERALAAADDAGNALLAAGLGLLLCLVCAVAGALVGARALGGAGGRGRRGHERHDTIPGAAPAHHTAPYPAVGASSPGLHRADASASSPAVTTDDDPSLRRDPLE